MSQQIKKPSLHQRLCNLMMWAVRPFSLPVDLMLHNSIGERYVGYGWVRAVLVMVVFACCASNPDPMSWLIGLFFIGLVSHNFYLDKLRRDGGAPLHSNDPGVPLRGLWRNRFEESTLRETEAWLVGLAGGAIVMFNTALGVYLICAGMSVLTILGIRESLERHKLLDFRDAELEKLADEEAVSRCRQELGLPTVVRVQPTDPDTVELLPVDQESPTLELAPETAT